jgi:hypothetical protein
MGIVFGNVEGGELKIISYRIKSRCININLDYFVGGKVTYYSTPISE